VHEEEIPVSFKLNFDRAQTFESSRFSLLGGVTGLYFIFLTNKQIGYPFKDSRLIYIGMSEKRTNSIASRLQNHYDGRSGNSGIQNYGKIDKLQFTYLNFDIIEAYWKQSIEDFESYLLLDFVQQFGVYPICNNKTGFPEFKVVNPEKPIVINWDYFG
jgi:hypothetical protein